MPAGAANVDYPAAGTALSVVPLGQDDALTSRVRRETDGSLYISPPRTGTGESARFAVDEMLALFWQADDGLRSVSTETLALAGDATWRLRVTDRATRVQRREAVRAPIGLPVSVWWERTTLRGSTVDLSEGGLLVVLRPTGESGVPRSLPALGQRLEIRLDLYSDELVTEVALIRRRPRQDNLHEWSLRFVDLPDPAADLIRSHVFTALRNARARGLAALY